MLPFTTASTGSWSSWSGGEHLAASNKPSSLVSCLRMVSVGFPRNHGIQISKVKKGKIWPEKKGEVGAFSIYFLRLTWKLMALKHILWLEPTNHWDDIINQSQDWMPNPLTSHFLSRGCPKSKELPKITWRI